MNYLLDAVAFAWYAMGQAWQQSRLAFARVSPLSMCRNPIPVALGPARVSAHIVLVSASTPIQLRLLSAFWRGPGESQRFDELVALAARYGAGDTLAFTGVVLGPSGARQALPLAFSAQIDLTARTVEFDHARITPGAETVCRHEAARVGSGWATPRDILASLLGRNLCPSLVPE